MANIEQTKEKKLRYSPVFAASTLRERTSRGSALSSHFSPLLSPLSAQRRLACGVDQADVLISTLDGNALLRNYASIAE